MGRLRASILAFSLAAIAVGGLAACGGDKADLLPGDTAGEITSNLDQVEQLAREQDCVGAADAAQAVSTQIEDLGGVDKKLKQTLQEGATRLNEVVAGCEEAPPEEETEPAVEPAEELEEAEKTEKPAKPEKPKKEAEAEEPAEETTSPTLPPQAEGKGHEPPAEEEAPPVETGGGTSAGGVGPGAPAGGE